MLAVLRMRVSGLTVSRLGRPKLTFFGYLFVGNEQLFHSFCLVLVGILVINHQGNYRV